MVEQLATAQTLWPFEHPWQPHDSWLSIRLDLDTNDLGPLQLLEQPVQSTGI
jgi:hypothetical protein